MSAWLASACGNADGTQLATLPPTVEQHSSNLPAQPAVSPIIVDVVDFSRASGSEDFGAGKNSDKNASAAMDKGQSGSNASGPKKIQIDKSVPSEPGAGADMAAIAGMQAPEMGPMAGGFAPPAPAKPPQCERRALNTTWKR